MASKRAAEVPPPAEGGGGGPGAAAAPPLDTLEVTPLGAGSEVGRSCILLSYKGKNVLLDCGIHPGLSGIASLPYFDEIDLAKVDVLLVTHFHLDHCAAVPFLLAHTPFRGRVFMTHSTKAIYHMLLADFVRLNRGGGDDPLFTEADLAASMERIEVVDFQQELDLGGIKVTPYRAGHVLGAAMFMVDIAGLRTLYTGDYSRKADRHLPGADTPREAPHVLIVESTYGVATHSPKEEREKRFLDRVLGTLRRGGRVLLPIVALGRAQELLLILEDYWSRHPEVQHIPVYQASALARRSLSIYQTYINMLNADMQAAFEHANPFALKYVKHLAGGRALDDSGPCVVLATPSMLQTGLSRELFEAWAGDARNGVIIADFAVQGTLARDILSDAKTVTTRAGLVVPIKCSVDAISFSAHADFPQTQAFVAELAPPHVVLVHGEAVEMGRLKRALEAAAAAAAQPIHVYTPKNCQSVAIAHRGEKVARVLGRLAERCAGADGDVAVGGVLVAKDFQYTLLHPADLATFTKLKQATLRQRQLVPCAAPFPAVRMAMEQLFEAVARVRSADVADAEDAAAASAAAVKPEAMDADAAEPAEPAAPVQPRSPLRPGDALSIGGRLTIAPGTAGGAPHVVLEWLSDPVSDMVADAALATLLAMEGPPAALAAAEAAHAAAAGTAAEGAARWRLFQQLLAAQFGPCALDEDAGTLALGGPPADVASAEADAGGGWVEPRVTVCLRTGAVACEDEARRQRVTLALERAGAALLPLPLPPQPED